jgi:hypothetical protein
MTSRSSQIEIVPPSPQAKANYQDGAASTYQYRPKIYSRHSCLGLRPDNENGVGAVTADVAISTSPGRSISTLAAIGMPQVVETA